MKRIGIFSSFIEPAALQLTDSLLTFINHNYPGKAVVASIFSNRDFGENPATDAILHNLQDRGLPLVIFSAARFKPDLRKDAKLKEKAGDLRLIQEWRNDFGTQVLAQLPSTDLDFLLGDMFIWGLSLCQARNGLNLHPALPDGPKGEWYNVIWELIKQKATESGVMMHVVTPELDRGPVATYCRYSLHEFGLDKSWSELPVDKNALEELIAKESVHKEKTTYPLHQRIRAIGLEREFPLILQTAAACIEDKIKLEDGLIYDREGRVLASGYDLTQEVERSIIEASRKRGVEN